MKNIFANRLKSARIRARMSLDELVMEMKNVISKQALSRYEQGVMLPSSPILLALADALKQTPDYFFAPYDNEVKLDGIEFRKYSSKLSKKEEEGVLQEVKDLVEKHLELLDRTSEKITPAPFSFSNKIKTVHDAEKAAKELRKQWNLGYDPIPSVVEMLEDKGYIVLVIKANENFSGMKATFNNHKIIVVNEGNLDRMRFTALHELAHHILNIDDSLTLKQEEKLCHAFAGAVLYPEEMARREMNKDRFHFYQNELVLIKARWGISMSAIFARALNLGIINDYVYTKLNVGYRKKGLSLSEPDVWRGIETPQYFERLLYRALAQDIISVNDAAYLKNMSVAEFRENLIPLA